MAIAGSSHTMAATGHNASIVAGLPRFALVALCSARIFSNFVIAAGCDQHTQVVKMAHWSREHGHPASGKNGGLQWTTISLGGVQHGLSIKQCREN